jgi:hypothetical protein
MGRPGTASKLERALHGFGFGRRFEHLLRALELDGI